MEISIVTCPQCNAMVLSDAGRCHVCDHVFDQERVEEEQPPVLPTDNAVSEDLETCPTCGETYRRGLVRCWNCGEFTRDEIKAAYNEMTSDPARYSQKDVGTLEELAPEVTARTGPWRVTALSQGVEVPAAPLTDELDAVDADFSFELADSVQLTDAVEAPSDSATIPSTETYSFSTPAPVAVPDTASAAPAEAEAIPLIAETTTEQAEKKEERRKAVQDVPEVAHSEATGGDVLLDIARQEEADVTRNRKNFASKLRGGFVVYCPMGCKIRVQERHRGKAGKCPKCHSVFFVPRSRPKPKAAESQEGIAVAAPVATEKWTGYLNDVHLHNVVPQKLRIKPDSLLNEFTAVDVVFSADGLLIATLVTSAGFLGANLKKKPALREALQTHLKTVATAEGAPAGQVVLIPSAQLGQLQMAQPSSADVESLFGNIPVFGTGRIAVRLPRSADNPATQYLSFSLSEFRAFVKGLETACDVTGLGADTEAPLTETYNTVPCHYSEAPVRELLALDYYKKDPNFKLQITGWRCGGCALVVSEDSRKKEKIGGLNGKKIASAKCPKCAAKYGSHPMYEVAAEAGAAPVAEAT